MLYASILGCNRSSRRATKHRLPAREGLRVSI